MEPYLGQTMIVAFDFAPRGWARCDGHLLPISQNQALFSLLGTTFGGDGRTNFALPDLRGRVPVHTYFGPYPLGYRGGAERVALAVSQLPNHTHTARAQSEAGDQRGPGGNAWAREAMGKNATYSDAASNAAMSAQAIGNAGGSQGHDNMQPFLTLNFVIALQGLFPSRG